MYIPKNHVNLKDVTETLIRMGIIGEAGTGKTTATLTFPNPIVTNIDNGLQTFIGRNIIQIPFHEHDFVSKILNRSATVRAATPNRRDAFLTCIREEAIKLESDQTLIVDSWTTLQDAFDVQTALDPAYTKEGKIDDFDFWARKLDFSRDVLTYLMSLKCNVIVIFHEQKERDKKT